MKPGAVRECDRALLAVTAASTVAAVVWMLWYCRYGIDFTDEGFYLVWISDPQLYKSSVSQFGFVYHPLFELLNGNIASLRQVNLLITLGLAWLAALTFLKTVFGPESLGPIARAVIAGPISATAVSAFVFAGMWLATPSYNSLTLQGLLVGSTGLMLADRRSRYPSVVGWVLIGTGGWLMFMAKPTTAAAWGVIAGLYLVLSGRLGVRQSAAAFLLASLLLCISAVAIDGSIRNFLERLITGLSTSSILTPGNSGAHLLRMDPLLLSLRGQTLLWVSSLVIFCAAYLSQRSERPMAIAGVVLLVLFIALIFANIVGIDVRMLRIEQFQGVMFFSIPFAAMMFGFFTSQSNNLSSITSQNIFLGTTLLLIPYAYAFGTGNNYWVVASGAGIFWVMAGLVLLKPASDKPEFISILLAFSVAALTITVTLVQIGITFPYRQPQPLRNNNLSVQIGRPGSTLVLSQDFGHYFQAAIEASRQAGFQKNTPMIDLSGRSPGLLYAIGASSIGQAWTLGGYPGSATLAVTMLRTVPCSQLVAAWVLVEPEGLGRISTDVLSSYGANAKTDFDEVGSFTSAAGAGTHVARAQILLKPNRSLETAEARCLSGRQGKS